MKHLKTIFACLLMAVLSIGQVWATEYELVYTLDCATASHDGTQSAYGVAKTTTMTGSGVKAFLNAAAGTTLVSNDATVSGVVYWAKGTGGPTGTPDDVLKIGKASGAGSITFTVGGDDDITKVVVTGYVWKTTSSISVNSATAQTYSTTGEEHDFVFDNLDATKEIGINVTTSAVCVTEIKLYKTKPGGDDQPNITASPVSAKYAVGDAATALSVTAEASAGDLHYAWKSNNQNSTTEGTITAVGTDAASYTPSTTAAGKTYYFCVVTDDNGSATSNVAEIEVKALSTIAQVVSDFIPSTDKQEGAEFALNDVTVTYVNGSSVYIKDASGYLLIYNVAVEGAANGKVLQGLWGKAKTYNKLPEITSITKAPEVVNGPAVAAEELDAFPTASDVNMYAVLDDVTFASARTLDGTVGDNFNGTFKTQTLAFRNNFLLGGESPISIKAGTSYSVVGIVNKFNDAIQFYPISFEEQNDPTVTLTPNALDFETIGVGDDAPAAKTFTVTGSYLTENLSAIVTAGSDYYDIAVKDGSLEKDGEGAVSATITVTPKAAINASAGTKAGTVTISGSGLSETVSLTTEVKAKHAINFNTGGLVVIPSVSVREGAEYAVTQTPAASLTPSCEFGTFVGWTTADEIADPSVKPTLIANSKVTMATEDITLHAVYSKTTGGGGTTEETASVTIGTYATANSWDNDTQYGSVTIDENITATAVTEGAYSGKYFSSGNDWRFYHTDDGILRISAADGCTLKSATLTFSAAKSGTLSGAGGDVTSETAYEISGSSYDFTIGGGESATKLNGQIKFTVISVTYDKSSGTITYSLDAGCCEPNTITIASGIEHGSVEADKEEACEGKTVTLTPTADPAYHFDAWDVYKTGESATKVTVTSNQFTMPAYAVTVSATFAHDDCQNLGAPTLNGTIEPTYNSATIAWNDVTGAVEYAVTVTNHTTSDVVFNGNVTELSKALTGLDPETHYDYTIMAVGDGVDKCADGNTLLEGSFTTAELPEVQLYYVKKQGADPIDGGKHTLGVEFDLVPSDLSCTKTFVGWTDEANKDYTHATDAPSVLLNKYTFTSEAAVTLYAVYAEVGPGTTTYTLTPAASVSEGVYVIAAYDENYKALTGTVSSGDLVNETTGFAIDGENKIVALPNDACEFTFTAVTGGYSIQNSDDDYLGYTSTSNRKIAFGDYSTLVWNATALSKEGYPDNGVYLSTSAYKVSCSTASSGSTTLVRGYASSTYNPIYLFKKATSAGSATNYTTTCIAAPEATPDPASLDVVAAGASGTITVTYDNVNTEGVTFALSTDESGSTPFSGDWLEVNLDGSKNITYTIAANTTYEARTAYIKLTAPETTGATDPAVVIIPVTQAKYIPEFESLADLVAADPAIPSGTDVKVSFSHVQISDDIAIVGGQRKGVYLDQKAANDKDVEIYYASSPYVPAAWVKNGYVSATNLVATWTHYTGYSSDVWELIPTKEGFNWATDLSYEAPSAAQISVSPSGDVAFAAVDRGTSVADKELTVTLTNVASAKAELTDANSVFSIDNETPASGEKIKISVDTDVEPNTYNAVLTISDNAGVADNVVINISITINAAETPVSTTSKWVIATTVADGDEVLLTGVKSDVTYALSTQGGNNRTADAGTLSEGVFTPGDNTMSVTLVQQSEGKFALRTSNGKYLYAASSSANNLKTRDAIGDDGKAVWSISINGDKEASIVANCETANWRNTMQFNQNNTNAPVFNCYASASQSVIKIYVPQTTPATPDYTRNVTVGNYGTICLPNGGTISGAKLYDLEYYDGASTLYLLEVNGNAMVAGRPYIFLPSVATIEVFYTDDANEPAGSFNGLVGSYTEEHITPDGSNYILLNNQYYRVVTDARVGANRAYIHMAGVPDAPSQNPNNARRRVAMTVNGTQTATGIEDLNASETPVKMMINGQIFILRGEKIYDTTGRLVK